MGQEIRDAYKELKTKGMKRLVLDLRGNGGGIMGEAVNIVSLFIPKGSVVVSAKGKAATEQVYKTTTDPVDTEIPIVVLVDNASASASEIVSGALQDYDRATIIGTRTYGKGLVQSIRPLPYDGQLKLTTAKYYTPSGRCVQAIDYSHRNEDGSVGHIPDSLTHAFTTAHGRTVRDGGGITPDFIVKPHKYSRLTYSLVYSGVIEQYALDYVRAHETIPALEDFHFTDYEEFIAFAKDKEFDYRSSARALFDEMKKSLEEDGLTEALSGELNALQKSLEMDKETFLRLKKEEIVPFIEEEIAVRYYFQQAGIRVRLRYDDQLHEALALSPPGCAQGRFPAAIAKNRPPAALRLQSRQHFGPKRPFPRPRLQKIGRRSTSRCNRGRSTKGRRARQLDSALLLDGLVGFLDLAEPLRRGLLDIRPQRSHLVRVVFHGHPPIGGQNLQHRIGRFRIPVEHGYYGIDIRTS